MGRAEFWAKPTEFGGSINTNESLFLNFKILMTFVGEPFRTVSLKKNPNVGAEVWKSNFPKKKKKTFYFPQRLPKWRNERCTQHDNPESRSFLHLTLFHFCFIVLVISIIAQAMSAVWVTVLYTGFLWRYVLNPSYPRMVTTHPLRTPHIQRNKSCCRGSYKWPYSRLLTFDGLSISISRLEFQSHAAGTNICSCCVRLKFQCLLGRIKMSGDWNSSGC